MDLAPILSSQRGAPRLSPHGCVICQIRGVQSHQLDVSSTLSWGRLETMNITTEGQNSASQPVRSFKPKALVPRLEILHWPNLAFLHLYFKARGLFFLSAQRLSVCKTHPGNLYESRLSRETEPIG